MLATRSLPPDVTPSPSSRPPQRVWGDQGNQVLEYLSKSPGTTVQTVHSRLGRKLEELCTIRTDMGEGGRAVAMTVSLTTIWHRLLP